MVKEGETIMKVTDLQFSVAKRNVNVGEDAAFLSIELDRLMVIHRFTIKRTGKGYVLNLPTQKTDKIAKDKIRPFVYISNHAFFTEIEAEVLEKFHALLKEYNDLYVRREHGPHN